MSVSVLDRRGGVRLYWSVPHWGMNGAIGSLKGYCEFILERIAILSSSSSTVSKSKSYPMMIGLLECPDGKVEPIASPSPSHVALAYAAHWTLVLAKIEELTQRKINRWLNSNRPCPCTFYQWESNSRAVSGFQFSFRLRYVLAFYSLHLYAS